MNKLQLLERKCQLQDEILSLIEEKERWVWDDAFTDEPTFYVQERRNIRQQIETKTSELNDLLKEEILILEKENKKLKKTVSSNIKIKRLAF